MAENLSQKLMDFLAKAQGREVSLAYLRSELRIDPASPAHEGIRGIVHRLVEKKILRPSGKNRNDGVYKVITQVQPVRVFLPGRERRPIFDLRFPCDSDTGLELDIAEKIVIREGDVITIGGVKSKGKTTLCLNFAGENIHKNPVLLGNEYTVLCADGSYDTAPRFQHRLDIMSKWVTWVDEEGYDRFTLLPVKEDYAEHIIPDRINIIDWLNMDANQLYDVSKVLEGIKTNLGRGIGIVALQKGELAVNPRGGQFVRDFSDVEILLDGFGDSDDDILLTVKGVKEKKAPIIGKTYAYSIVNEGTQIVNFREVKKCFVCKATGYTRSGECENCRGKKYINC